MSFLLRDEERKAIKALLRFANMRAIGSDAQVARCFAGLVEFRDFTPMWIDPKTGRETQGVSFKGHHEDVQRVVRNWLARATSSLRGRRDATKEIAKALPEVVSAHLRFRNARIEYAHEFESVQAACAYAMALVLDARRGLASRLKRCGWSGCGRFNLDLKPKGRSRRFCNKNHARLFSNEDSKTRQQRHRDKLKGKT